MDNKIVVDPRGEYIYLTGMEAYEIVDLLFDHDKISQLLNTAAQLSKAEASRKELPNKMQNLTLENSDKKEKAESSNSPKPAT